ncbi:histidine phosphatase family protein [Planotetraspora sp. A-T 1434]|uniref:histidine phosphatase family protein n=1 Tax=Planotetraspora sp. A-T 1434 TaxID=2979219 RepID=UPI0021C0F3BD|nr:histidine phosphatase family protein [Planotetraspora sp. A-T 1434]MCT9930809.1 histidine phosphatase family protein [Planotetraspora sp. A-T 1434]
MTVRLVLVCHGYTEAMRRAAFPLDEELDERGLRQASDAAPLYAAVKSASCGPSRCCRETAAALGLRAEVDEGLRDCDFGHWAGRSLAEVQAADPEGVRAWLTDPSAAPHGGEPVLALVDRVGAWLASAASGVAVTHPAVMRAAVVHVLRTPAESFWAIDAEPLSRVSLTGHGGRWRLRFTD